MLLIIFSIGAYLLVNKEDNNSTKQSSETVTPIIEEGQTIERKTIKYPITGNYRNRTWCKHQAPDDWIATPVIDLDYNGIITRTIGITSSSDPMAPAAIVAMSTQHLENSKSQAEFEKVIKDLFIAANSMGISNGSKSQTKATISKLYINDREWTKYYTEFPTGQSSITLYWWNKDHAVELVVQADNKELLGEKTNDYLLPIAASIKSD